MTTWRGVYIKLQQMAFILNFNEQLDFRQQQIFRV